MSSQIGGRSISPKFKVVNGRLYKRIITGYRYKNPLKKYVLVYSDSNGYYVKAKVDPKYNKYIKKKGDRYYIKVSSGHKRYVRGPKINRKSRKSSKRRSRRRSRSRSRH